MRINHADDEIQGSIASHFHSMLLPTAGSYASHASHAFMVHALLLQKSSWMYVRAISIRYKISPTCTRGWMHAYIDCPPFIVAATIGHGLGGKPGISGGAGLAAQ